MTDIGKYTVYLWINHSSHDENGKISYDEISNDEISNDEISNNEISNDEISNADISNDEISNGEMSNYYNIYRVTVYYYLSIHGKW